MTPRLVSLLLAAAALSSCALAHEGHEEEEASSSGSSGSEVEVVGGECDSATSAEVIATIDNSTYFSTCALEEGVTFNVTSLFDVLNFTSSDFALFCNSSTCLEPVHAMLHSIPTDCLVNYDGSDRNLSAEITAIHDECHEVLEGIEEGSSSSNASASASADNASASRYSLTSTALAVAAAVVTIATSTVV